MYKTTGLLYKMIFKYFLKENLPPYEAQLKQHHDRDGTGRTEKNWIPVHKNGRFHGRKSIPMKTRGPEMAHGNTVSF